MKNNVLALSLTAALAVLASSVSAQSVGIASATQLEVNYGGIGHIQIIPYYTVQNTNNTLLNIVNADPVNGKAVKVRFRGARNSDDVFDFYLLLSPGDAWRARVYRDETGNTRLDLNGDTTCTYPANAAVQGTAFPTSRVFNQDVAETREGYVELLTAADIPPGSDLYTAIKHVNGVAPCYTGATSDAIENAFFEPLVGVDAIGTPGDPNYVPPVEAEMVANVKGFYVPTTGLMANWAVMDVETGSTASGRGTALQAVNANSVAATGKIVVAPQSEQAAPEAWLQNGTIDPLFMSGALTAAYYDFPDLSTPYLHTNVTTDAGMQANIVSNALAVSQLINEFTTGEAGFKTDWVFSMPTRRYGVAIDYENEEAVYSVYNAFFTENNAKFVVDKGVPSIQINLNATYWDKEEGRSSTSQGAVISPSTPAGLPYVSGEVNVFTFNGNAPDSILGGAIAYNNISPLINRQSVGSGWASFSMERPLATTYGIERNPINGLPVIGYATMTAGNGINLTYSHSSSRVEDARIAP